MARGSPAADARAFARAVRQAFAVPIDPAKTTARTTSARPRLQLIDSCGCAMSAVFMSFGILGAAIWIALLWRTHPQSPWSIAWRLILVTFAAAAVGKVFGILAYRMRNNPGLASRAGTVKDR
jgi:hypothetical protein